MSDGAIVQYRGFAVKLLVREYTFNVREAGSEREFTLSIENEAFVSHRARYQDAPSICSERLKPSVPSVLNSSRCPSRWIHRLQQESWCSRSSELLQSWSDA